MGSVGLSDDDVGGVKRGNKKFATEEERGGEERSGDDCDQLFNQVSGHAWPPT